MKPSGSDRTAWARQHTFAVLVYRQSPHLEACIASLERQLLPSRIVLCTSTPSPWLDDIARRHELPVVVNPVAGGGIAADWNFALAQAETPFCTLAHQDDCYEPEFLAAVADLFIRHPRCLITFTDYSDLCGNEKRHLRPYLLVKRLLLWPYYLRSYWESRAGKYAAIAWGNAICCPSVTYHKALFPDFHFDTSFSVNLDWASWLQLARRDGGFGYVARPVMLHRISAGMETRAAILDQRRYREDLRMFEAFWPGWFARFLMRFYSAAYQQNQA